MANKVLLETGYTFTPSTKTLVIPKYIARERIIRITNATTHHVIYDANQPELNLVSYASNTASATASDSTTLVFKFNTAGSNMSSTDKLQITVDEYAERVLPAESMTDPTNKQRVTSPQALIDTDFEYGTQVSKWENLATTNLRPFAYNNGTNVPTITKMTMTAGSRVVTVTGTALPYTSADYGKPIIVQDTLLPIANGTFAIDTSVTPSATTFAYVARAAATVDATSGNGIFDSNKTQIIQASLYTGAAIGGAPTSVTNSGTKVSITTSIPHGLSIGNEILVTGTTASTAAPNGTWVVATVDTATTFSFYVSTAPTGTIVFSSAAVYARPQGAVLHRPFDGGVIFSSNGLSNYEAQTRQTRRYFRYQSGKGILFSSGTILKPNFQLDSLKYATSTNLVTVTTKDQHNLQPGSTIVVSGANEALFNGTVTIYGITGYNTFTYTPTAASGSNITASGNFYASIINWYGAVNRLGIFDQQNGLFFEFDGQTLYAVKRNSTYQTAGRVDVTNGSTSVTSNALYPTTFSTQLVPGDYIVLRGQSYRVDAVTSDTALTISPAYRGTSSTAVTVSKTIDYKIPQSQWNIDKMDGTGHSGYNLDLSRMQMFYIDYSWYGAGFIRWGLRGANGDVTYIHKMQNNNVNFEAYMRSGNLPGRYESLTQPVKTILGAAVASGDTTITVASTSGFPTSGTAIIKGATAYEHFNYTGTTATTFTGVTRAQAGATVATGLTTAVGSNSVVNTAAFANAQIGQRVISNTANAVYPDGTFITAISADLKTLTLSAALTGNAAATSITYAPMGATAATTQSYSATAPVAVELAFPTFAPTISHWGTSVIMDGRFDDDKSLLFTYGTTANTTIAASAVNTALLSIRIAPSVDNGKAANFGARDLTNRMQLVPRTLDIVTTGATQPLLISMNLNGVPVATTAWTAVSTGVTSSLAQVADHGATGTTVTGGETVGGFFVSGTASIDLSLVRDLGNSILGGGGTTANTGVYPDGPDVLTVQVTNLSATGTTVRTRLAWTEAQA